MNIQTTLGDITREQVDAIVNAANSSLRGGGGVDGAIHRAAGKRLAEAGAALAPCRTGDAKATPAFNLDPPVRYIIHTVGPVWRGGRSDEPAISTGIYGYPPRDAARIAVSTISQTPTSVRLIRLVAFDQATLDLLTQELG
jgi:O-acetyl-ADP-ribose deacetylase (regulator of RNase III)